MTSLRASSILGTLPGFSLHFLSILLQGLVDRRTLNDASIDGFRVFVLASFCFLLCQPSFSSSFTEFFVFLFLLRFYRVL